MTSCSVGTWLYSIASKQASMYQPYTNSMVKKLLTLLLYEHPKIYKTFTIQYLIDLLLSQDTAFPSHTTHQPGMTPLVRGQNRQLPVSIKNSLLSTKGLTKLQTKILYMNRLKSKSPTPQEIQNEQTTVITANFTK